MDYKSRRRFQGYFIAFSIILSLIGFSYNVWRLEVTEQNSTIRTASFELLKELSELEQLIYLLHYDKNTKDGSPRKGWVKVGLIRDLSPLAGEEVEQMSNKLMSTWSNNWNSVENSRQATDSVITAIDKTRESINKTLASLH
ncbi:hypothetical protein D5018_00660 [Parashewanella curva]|uniref:Uncharacterized protein n=1 Tax=Parashewanella curva TaxID=2338552 RepID=A0A3L8Q3V9_9GAMM|nr:hypothetical protein [Parashewanella curva]RLV61662.1 hypothetical protein D5018_00660 [Parashewanella curva]